MKSSSCKKAKFAADPAARAASAEQKRAARRAADPALLLRDAQRAERREQQAAKAALRADHCHHVDTYLRARALCEAHVEEWKRQSRQIAPRDDKLAAYERAKAAWKRAKRLRRLPPWVELRDTVPAYLKSVLLEKQTGMKWEVDHVIALRGNEASGLHVPGNLSPLPSDVNQGKRNETHPSFLEPKHFL